MANNIQFCQLVPTAMLCLLLSANAMANDRLRFSGFGTLGYAATDSDTAEYRTGRAQDGADNKGSFEVDTRLGVQADYRISRSSSATLQLIAREAGDGSPEVFPEWAFLKKQLNDSIGVRVGRIGLGIFMASEFREVGFAQPLLRPPEETYVQLPMNSFDGIDLIGNFTMGETLLTVQAIAGQHKSKFYDDLDVDMKSVAGFNLVAETDHWRWRLTHNVVKVSISSYESEALGQSLETANLAFPQFAQLSEVARDFNGERKAGGFSGIGVEYDKGNVFVNAELTTRKVDQFLPDTTGWYIAAGYRLGSVTPYAYVSELKQDSKDTIDFPPVQILQGAATILERIYAPADQKAIAAGLRWDFKPNFAFKAQVERIDRERTGINFFRLADPLQADGDTVNLYSLALDFIF